MGTTKKIVFVLPKLGRGGAEQVVAQLANRFSENQGEALCVCLEEIGTLGENLRNKRFKLVCIDSHRSYDLLAVFKLAKVIKLFQPEIVSVHSYFSLPYVVLSRFLVKDKYPIIFTAHGLLYTGFESRRWLYRIFSRFINQITAVSDEVAKRHKEYLNWSEEITVIENGSENIVTNFKDGLKIRKEFQIPEDSFVFIAIGNLRPEKGIEDLLKALSLIKKEFDKNFVVVIVGAFQDILYYKYLVKLSSDLGVDNKVFFLGHRTDISSIYSCANSFILPSRSEGLPMVLLEAMSCNLPVIATKVGGVPKVLKDNIGILVNSNSPMELAGAMLMLMKKPELCAKLGNRGYNKFQESYTVDKMLEGYLSIFNKLIDKFCN